MKNKLAPICLFVYNRIEETKQTVQALQVNHLANNSDLIIFSDGYKNDTDKIEVEKVRAFIREIKGFKTIKIFRVIFPNQYAKLSVKIKN